MRPNLTLPPQPSGGDGSFPSQPLEVQAWLTRLPTLDTHTTLVKMQDGLTRLVHLELDSKNRMQCLEHFRRTVTEMGLKFHRHLIGLSLPLSQQTLEVALAYGELYGTLAAGYKRIILDADGRKPQGVNIAAVTFWAIYYTVQKLRCVYGSYSRAPKGLWYEIHQLFDFARFIGIQHEELKVGKQRMRTVTHLYKRALLMGLSDPYHLPFRTIDKIYEALDRWADRANLRTAIPQATDHCLFLIDSELDRPAMPVLPKVKMRDGTNRLLLDTSKLVIHLKRKMTRTYNETMARSNKSHETDWFVTFDEIETLQNLIVKWGLHPIRRDRRSSESPDYNCELVAGLSAVHYVFNGGRPLPQRTVDDRRVSSSLLMGSFGLAQSEQQRTLDKRQTWQLQDESERGLRLVLTDTQHAQVRVGDLVAFRIKERFEDWQVGVIRWAQTIDGGALSVGVHKLSDTAHAVAVQLMADRQNSLSARYAPGLVLPRLGSDEYKTLITDQSVYRVGEHIWA